ncbi:MAG: tRNA pseudouridine(55) synthase TruB [Vicinamibacterales bacterium]
MDGLLIVDKPSGPTSHDVVAAVRRLVGSRAGHTGTLDPLASGVLPVVVGRATRLARFLSGAGKTYEATVRLGSNTDTCDAAGEPVGPPFEGAMPDAATIDAALESFRGTFEQQPPVYSAKKIGGRPSYALARRARRQTGALELDAPPSSPSTRPLPVRVTAYRIDLIDVGGADVRLRLRCSAGFYVRALAHDLGAALGTGAHLAALRRTAIDGIDGEAVPLQALVDQDGRDTAARMLVPLGSMLRHLPAVTLLPESVPRARAGRDLGEQETSVGFREAAAGLVSRPTGHVRLLAPTGDLVAIAEAARTPGLLHPSIVLI